MGGNGNGNGNENWEREWEEVVWEECLLCLTKWELALILKNSALQVCKCISNSKWEWEQEWEREWERIWEREWE